MRSSLYAILVALPTTWRVLAMVAIYTTNVDAEHQTLINHKCVCGALNRHFCQTRVMRSPFFLGRGLSVHCCCVCAAGKAYSLASFGLALAMCDLQECMTVRGN